MGQISCVYEDDTMIQINFFYDCNQHGFILLH